MDSFNLKDVIISVVSGLVGIFMIVARSYIVHYFEKLFKGDLDPVVKTLNVTKLLRDSLDRLMTDWGANRAIIIQFHNGGRFYNGTSMQKMSVTHEEHTPGVFPIYRVLQNVPITTCPYIKEIIDKTYAVDDAEDVGDIIANTFYYEFGIKSAIGVPLYSDTKVVGVLILQYTERKIKFKQGDIDQLTKQCSNFYSLLC
ncbi:GAF domain-containing protein [bacterium]|nr:GAF domain-containing protein [bacterium]